MGEPFCGCKCVYECECVWVYVVSVWVWVCVWVCVCMCVWVCVCPYGTNVIGTADPATAILLISDVKWNNIAKTRNFEVGETLIFGKLIYEYILIKIYINIEV